MKARSCERDVASPTSYFVSLTVPSESERASSDTVPVSPVGFETWPLAAAWLSFRERPCAVDCRLESDPLRETDAGAVTAGLFVVSRSSSRSCILQSMASVLAKQNCTFLYMIRRSHSRHLFASILIRYVRIKAIRELLEEGFSVII